MINKERPNGLKIGIDCIAVDENYIGGVNTYLFGLLDGFEKNDLRNNEIVIFCSKYNVHLFKKYKKFNLITLKKYNKTLRRFFLLMPFIFQSVVLWKIFNNFFSKLIGANLILSKNCDILYTATTNLNFYNLDVITIVSMHDIQQYHYPKNFTFRELVYRKLLFENTAKFADYIQASSNFIKEDIVEKLNVSAERILVIREGVDVSQFSQEEKESSKIINMLPKKFIFLPAQLWKHKNHLTILKSILYLKHKIDDIHLVFTGAAYSSAKNVFQFIKNNDLKNVHYLGVVSRTDLISIYKKAFLTISPAIYESSSLTVLESAASGTPILASNTEPNYEMSQNLELELFDTMDHIDFSNKLLKIWNEDIKYRDKKIKKNLLNIKNYKWKTISEIYLKNLNKIYN